MAGVSRAASKVARRGEVGTAAPCQSLAGAGESCSPSSVIVCNLEPSSLKPGGERETEENSLQMEALHFITQKLALLDLDNC